RADPEEDALLTQHGGVVRLLFLLPLLIFLGTFRFLDLLGLGVGDGSGDTRWQIRHGGGARSAARPPGRGRGAGGGGGGGGGCGGWQAASRAWPACSAWWAA